MTMPDVPAVGRFASQGPVFPASKLSEDRWPAVPLGSSLAEQFHELDPAPYGFVLLSLEGLGDRLSGGRHLQGQAPGAQGASGGGAHACCERICTGWVCERKAAMVEDMS